MKKSTKFYYTFIYLPILILIFQNQSFTQSTLDCSQCHQTEHIQWLMSHHANTQNDVASELAGEWAGLPPDSVIFGQNAEDCIACHSATSIKANGGMSEVETMGYFFSTTNGHYTDSTEAIHTNEWPQNACVTCHNVPDDHPVSMPTLAIFNSPTAQYNPVANASMLCGQCHGTLRYPTDHRTLDAWQLSKHGHGGQNDVAGEIAAEWAGFTPLEVTNQEDCIACHAPISVLLYGGITEADALKKFFTTENGVFTANTVPQNTNLWPEVACTSCHNQHNPEAISYFNSGTKEYQVFNSSQELCGQCHGNLRFPATDHLSYNIEQGTGGIGVPNMLTMPGVKCVDCHMHIGNVEGSNALMFGGHLWSVFIQENNNTETASCTSCHASINANTSHLIIEGWRQEFVSLDSAANVKVSLADTFLIGSSDSVKIHMLQEALFNLAYAEGDESGGVHNHTYTISLLNDAIEKATHIITGLNNNLNPVVEYELSQNYPNPFNPSTKIKYSISQSSNVIIKVFDILGDEIETLINEEKPTGTYELTWNAANLPSGVYFYRIKATPVGGQAGDPSTSSGQVFIQTKKMILLK